MKKILISENDTNLAKLLKQTLSQKYQCFLSSTIADSIEIVEKHKIDLIILDRILDDGDSIDMIDYLNEFSFQTKIIFLSEKGSVDDRIKGLLAGSDEYLPKPFSEAELKIRIERLLFKLKVNQSEEIKVNNIILQTQSSTLSVNQDIFQLKPRESQVLSCLMANQGRIVTRNSIIKSVWSGEANLPEPATLDVYIRRLRISLKNYSNLIVTKRGMGYMFNPLPV